MNILETLGLTWQSLLFHFINLVIIVVAAYFLLRKPIRKMVKRQNQQLSDIVDENKRLTEEAEEQKRSIVQITADAKEEAARIYKETEQKATVRADTITEEAQALAKNIVESARKEAAAECERISGDYEKRVAALSIEIAEKILAREVALSDNQKIIDACIEEIGS